jgi:hypothetical protein
VDLALLEAAGPIGRRAEQDTGENTGSASMLVSRRVDACGACMSISLGVESLGRRRGALDV